MKTTRDRILAEATRQIVRVGYDAFTIASVRETLELSSGSMFHAFASKPALAAAVYVEGMAGYQRTALAAIGRHEAAELALRAWVDAHLTWISDHRDLARYLFSTLPDDVIAAAAGPLAQYNDAFYAGLTDLLARAADEGLCAQLERQALQSICIGPAHDYGRRWAAGQVETVPRKLSRVFQDAAIAGLAATIRSNKR